jgi:predicted nucleic acid-binding protein
MRLLIHDANVLIDLLDIGLLDEAMALPCVMETTDLVQHEIVDVEQTKALSECIGKGLLAVLSSSIEQISKITEMQRTSPQLTLADCSVFFHAQDKDGVVLSGDGRLRKEAARL